MKDVLLIFPSRLSSAEPDLNISNPPLGLGYIASVLRNNGYNVLVNDIANHAESFMDLMKEHKPSIIGISSPTPVYSVAVEVAKEIRAVNKDVFLVMGGPHAVRKDQILSEVKEFDAVVYGEGEQTMLELTQAVIEGKSKFSNIDGLVFREGKKIVVNKPRALMQNLDKLPFPARDLLKIERYQHPLTLLTSRGCPYGCVYCDKSIFGRTWRGRSYENIIQEIETVIHDYPKISKRYEFSVLDDVFNLDMDRAKKLCDEIIRRNLDVKFACINGIRADHVDSELLEKMKKAGWRYIQYGIESGDNSVLKTIHKEETVEDIVKAVKLTQKIGIKVGGSFIVDLPGTSPQNIEKTKNLLKELELERATLNFLAPYPNTPVWDWVHSDKNVKILVDLESIKKWTRPSFETPEFTAEEKWKAFNELVSVRNRILLRKFIKRIVFGKVRVKNTRDFLMKVKIILGLLANKKRTTW